jgi:GYF domain 2
MGIRFYCPNGHKLHVKAFQAGERGICPHCGVSLQIPGQSTRASSRDLRVRRDAPAAAKGSDTVTLIENDINDSGGPGPAAAAAGNAAPAPASRQPSPPIVAEGSVPPPSSVPTAPGAQEDPLAGPEEVVWYVRVPSGGQFGPATPEIMRGWIAEGRVSPDSLVWREGWRDWREAAQVFPQLTAPDDAVSGLEGPAANDAIPELESIVAEAMPLSGIAPSTQPALSRSKKHSSGSPLLVMLVLVGLGVALLLAVFLWVKFT